ncbi:WD40-repeat-containing domain protein [Gamsiella multidivaricata]|uniref:WD40-repeat-containing domain protein n=1 Tax=Gamsiella multidivaricata TaxID=101098 RepID=UPI002220F27A|nr:WD40-repeat-containing domain protein [Gamsiella multidivaricata]KAG0366147.1 hypothetical protein BGZ54_005742 [Gamsiella multidivaricata]KAI7831661.1 WD40-repeat-containing domain protein [Gamsiella multidivaricata]
MSKPVIDANIMHVANKRLDYTAFQALWIPGTTKICAFGSNDSGFGVIQVCANTFDAPAINTSAKGKKRSATKKPAAENIHLELVSETEKKTQFKSGTFRSSARTSTLPHLLTGDFEGRVGQWDLNRTEFPLSTFKAHEDVVNCMDGAGAVSGRPEFVTGCRDGTVKLWDARQNHKEAAAGGGASASPISNIAPKKGAKGHDVWCVTMGTSIAGAESGADDLLVAAGYDNGDIRVLDLRMGRPIFEMNIKFGVCSLEFDRRHGGARSMVASTLEGTMHTIAVVDGELSCAQGNWTPLEGIGMGENGEGSTLWQGKHVPQRPDIFVVTDSDGKIHMFQHGDVKQRIRPLGFCDFANEGVLSLEFNEDLEGFFVACDLDNQLRMGMLLL